MSTAPVTVWIDDYELPEFVRTAAKFGAERFGYVVTPNVDHLIRFHDDHAFREIYEKAAFTVLDSRFLAHLVRIIYAVRLPVCTGSDVTAALLKTRVAQEQTLVLIGGDEAQAQELKLKYGLQKLRHFNPPYGFIRSAAAVLECIKFVEANSPFGFCLLAVGSPQQEMLARQLAFRGQARGLALCVGASVDFITGREKRAPQWVQQVGFEWLYRLFQNPSRLARRYLIRGPRIFRLIRNLSVQVRAKLETADATAPMVIE